MTSSFVHAGQRPYCKLWCQQPSYKSDFSRKSDLNPGDLQSVRASVHVSPNYCSSFLLPHKMGSRVSSLSLCYLSSLVGVTNQALSASLGFTNLFDGGLNYCNLYNILSGEWKNGTVLYKINNKNIKVIAGLKKLEKKISFLFMLWLQRVDSCLHQDSQKLPMNGLVWATERPRAMMCSHVVLV